MFDDIHTTYNIHGCISRNKTISFNFSTNMKKIPLVLFYLFFTKTKISGLLNFIFPFPDSLIHNACVEFNFKRCNLKCFTSCLFFFFGEVYNRYLDGIFSVK